MYYGCYLICDLGVLELSNKRIGRNLKLLLIYLIVKMEVCWENGVFLNILICYWLFQIIGDVYDVQFLLVRKFWDGWEIVKFFIIEKFFGLYENQFENQIDRLYVEIKIYRNNERFR